MIVTINGENKEVVSELNLIQILNNFQIPTERIAIELNKDVIRKKDWEQIIISDQDKIEIIHFVGGG